MPAGDNIAIGAAALQSISSGVSNTGLGLMNTRDLLRADPGVAMTQDAEARYAKIVRQARERQEAASKKSRRR